MNSKMPSADGDMLVRNLKQIFASIGVKVGHLRDDVETCVRRETRRMAEESIRESKSSVTRKMFLQGIEDESSIDQAVDNSVATVFVPLVLSASIFGMNVQEINGTGHSMRSRTLYAYCFGMKRASESQADQRLVRAWSRRL